MYVQLNKTSLQWLRSNKIFFDMRGSERLKEGEWLFFNDDLEVEPYVGFRSGYILNSMGSFSFTNSALIPHMAVGRYCSISWNVRCEFYRHPIEHFSTSLFTHETDSDEVKAFLADQKISDWKIYPNPQKPAPRLDHDVWIGAHAALNPGIVVATGAVVAAGSVVTKSVGAYEIVGGNPAKPIRKRFDDETVRLLLESEWWNYKFSDFRDLPFDHAKKFAELFLKRKADLDSWRPRKIRLRDVPCQNRA